jgi:hypothetical protein
MYQSVQFCCPWKEVIEIHECKIIFLRVDSVRDNWVIGLSVHEHGSGGSMNIDKVVRLSMENRRGHVSDGDGDRASEP